MTGITRRQIPAQVRKFKRHFSKAIAPGTAFVGTPISVKASLLPFLIATGVVLDVASVDERKVIKEYLNSLSRKANCCAGFERFFTEKKLPPSKPIDVEIDVILVTSKSLSSKDWRYYVIDIENCAPFCLLEEGCSELAKLQVATDVTSLSLRLSPLFTDVGVIARFTSDWEYFTHLAPTKEDIKTIDQAYLHDLRSCFAMVRTVFTSHPDIAHSITLYSKVPDRLGHNELTVLGLFSVLESLLTHAPRGETDSVGHQIRSKIALLDKRLRFHVDYSPFGNAPRDTIWKKLYELRSRIAHGTPVDFGKTLSMLDDAYTVELFLRETVRRFLRGALEEPDLFVDLKAV